MNEMETYILPNIRLINLISRLFKINQRFIFNDVDIQCFNQNENKRVILHSKIIPSIEQSLSSFLCFLGSLEIHPRAHARRYVEGNLYTRRLSSSVHYWSITQQISYQWNTTKLCRTSNEAHSYF